MTTFFDVREYDDRSDVPVMTAADVEKLWDRFVPRLNGKRVGEYSGSDVRLPNADYVFPEEGIIAELKVLTADLERTKAGQEKLNSMFNRWRRNGLINMVFYGTAKINSKDLPRECELELIEYFGKRLQKIVSDANKQIRCTKNALKMDDAFGLLLLVNDGSFHLSIDAITYCLSRALRKRTNNEGQSLNVPNKSIDNVVVLTVAMPSHAPDIPVPVQTWLPAFRDSRRISEEFLSRLEQGWFNYISEETGAPVSVFTAPNHEMMRKMKFTQTGREPRNGNKKR